MWSDLDEEKKKLNLSREKYMKMMHDVEQSEISIEQALLEHEKGQMQLEQVQRITNQTLNVKYKAEMSAQEYKKEIEIHNQHLLKFADEYKPLLQRLQQGEESRINFQKYNFEKFLKHLGFLGKELSERGKEIHSSVSMINTETDLKIFIDEHRTHNKFESKIEFKHYEQSDEVK